MEKNEKMNKAVNTNKVVNANKVANTNIVVNANKVADVKTDGNVKEKVVEDVKGRVDEDVKGRVGEDAPEKTTNKGGRNLVIMGALATIVALTTTTVALTIYHNSGDIYLDRSRPGFLPDEAEIKTEGEEEGEDYDFANNGKLTEAELDEFIEKLTIEIEAVRSYEKPFDEDALSDERLGITAKADTKVPEGEGME